MDALWAVAPPTTWGLLTLSSAFLMAGFVLLSHTLVRAKAYGDAWHGLRARGRLEATVRLGVASLLAGGALWAPTLDAPPSVGWVLAGGAVALAVSEVFTRLR